VDEHSQPAIRTAFETLISGGIIAYPTETVYGLGCLPNNIDAIKRLLAIKHRSSKKGLILIAANRQQLLPYISSLSDELWKKLATNTTSPVSRTTTWIVPAGKPTNRWLSGNRNTLAVRITQHPTAHALCLKCNSPLISTSANLSGSPPVKLYTDLPRSLSKQLDFVLQGYCGGESVASRIEDIISGEIIRA
jgi:L-threonylcarbamoyladenylate synthase